MYRATAAILFLATEALAHPGHGAPEGHFHGLGWDHILGAVAIVALVFGLRYVRSKRGQASQSRDSTPGA